MKKAINFNKVSFFYDKNNSIFNNFSTSVPSDGIITVLGHNGAGKTTFIRLLLNLLQPNQGSIDKNNITFSYLPSENPIYADLTVDQNINFYKKLFGIKEVGSTLNTYFQQLQINSFKRQKVKNLSTGQKRRLGLFITLMKEADYIVLDEPTIGIDPESLEIIIRIIKGLTENQKTVILATHDLYFVQEIADYIMILDNGKLLFNGNKDELGFNIRETYLSIIKSNMEEEGT
ncbi:ATP-binding cassette domain-containing protein [Niallia sp. 01092]|uniref:ATP-binding cassette domain-containing protein n=1 Tax=unclassified Niallia TaxID=2837522 RepID=UPI003FD268D7